MIIDSHQHVWDPQRLDYPWLGPEQGSLFRTYAQAEVEPLFEAAGVQASVLVQSADSVAETRWMQRSADASSRVRAIVAWVPLDDPSVTAALLDDYADDTRIVGVRHLIHDEADEDWLVRPAVQDGLQLVAERGLTFDVVAVTARHLEHVPTLSERHPDLRVVIDHLAKPPIASGGWQPWARLLAEAAGNPMVHAKMSGLNTAAVHDSWSVSQLRPYVEYAIELFGPGRLMFGGDWPVSVLAGGYAKWWSATSELLSPLGEPERAAVLGGTAAAFYRIPGLSTPSA